MRRTVLVLAAVTCLPIAAGAQWTNRYTKNAGYAHHVYLEGYELPILANGPMDVAAAPDGATLLFASRGWLWRFDEATGVATRLTSAAGVDSRPAWSPDGRRIAFVRDDGATLAVIVRNVDTGEEAEVDRGMALDPAFTFDGQAVLYSSVSPQGDLDLYRHVLATGERARLTSETGLELRPLAHPDGRRIVYTSKARGGVDQVRLRTLADGREQPLIAGSILSQIRPALSPDGWHIAYNFPGPHGWELRLSNVDRPGVSIVLVARPRGRPLAPAWSRDGRWIWYSEADRQQQLRLWRVSSGGGTPREVTVRRWDWGVPTARFTVRTDVRGIPTAARLSVTDASGHPVLPDAGMVRFDGQNGRPFFYSSGTVVLEAPAGRVTARATHGFAAPEEIEEATIGGPEGRAIAVTFNPLWDPRAAGWYSGDHHFHLNYGGSFDLLPEDLALPMLGEDLDVGTPMLANLHNRFENQDQWGWSSGERAPLVTFAQEVRSHFLGHVGLIATTDLFWPWVWGPGYEVYGRDDRTNSIPLLDARRQGGLGVYVHPTTNSAPFSENGLASIPIGLVADAVHGSVDLLELVCLWSNEVGTTDIWYRLLNAGLAVMPSAGTDVMTDLHRTMAVGATRVYVRPAGGGPLSWPAYLAALKAGRSFVTTGPLIDFEIQPPGRAAAGKPGDVIGGRSRVRFTANVYSMHPLDSVNVVVNGRTIAALGRLSPSGLFKAGGSFSVPAGGWVALRVVGPRVDGWPSMASRVFAHTSPVWIGSAGSTDPASRRAAAADLLRALANAEQRLAAGYGDSPIPLLKAHLASARARLEVLARPATLPRPSRRGGAMR